MAGKPDSTVKTIVLVHGGFVDGSRWEEVYRILKKDGYNVSVVQNPTRSLEDDVAVTKRVLATQKGPVILVGHSYGGVVITEAGNDPQVVGLVYAAAFAPDAGQSITDISINFPKPAGLDMLVPQADGFLLLSPEGIEQDFAQDLTKEEKARLVTAQPQTAGSIFNAKPTSAAWREKPTWYIVATNDRMIAPEQEKSMAKQMNATTTVLSSSHVVMLSQPNKVAEVINEAVAS